MRKARETKNQAACESLEYDDERKLASKRVVFRSLNQDSEEFELLLELFLWGLVLFKSADMQWTRFDHMANYYVFSLNGRFTGFLESEIYSPALVTRDERFS